MHKRKNRISEYNKEYYLKNKQRIKEKYENKKVEQKVKVVCECGLSHFSTQTRRHIKGKTHQRHIKQQAVLNDFTWAME